MSLLHAGPKKRFVSITGSRKTPKSWSPPEAISASEEFWVTTDRSVPVTAFKRFLF